MWQDVRFAVRMMRRTPGFTAVAVASLALGIGANTAIFSLLHTVLLRPLPVREPGQLVELLSRYPGEPPINGFSSSAYEHFRNHNRVFADLIGASSSRFRVGGGLDAEAVEGEYVAGTYFTALGITPAIGRLIGPQDDQPGSASAGVAVLSWSYWRSRFNLDPSVLGRPIVVDDVPVTVVGVTEPAFFGLQVGAAPHIWLPVAAEPLLQRPARRANGQLGLRVMGRLAPGVSIEQARASMDALNRWRIDEIARTNKDPLWRKATLDLQPASTGLSTLRSQFGRPLLVLMIVVGLLLLVACANVAGMLLARAAARKHEMATRVALGAGRWRLARQALTESLLLSVAGGLAGVVLAYVGVDVLVRIISSGRQIIGLPGRLEIQVQPDLPVLLFTALVALLTGVLFGSAPAWHAFASAPASSLHETAVVGEPRARRRLAKGLVVAQVALSVVLLSAAGLLTWHLSNLRSADLGFEHESVLLVTLDPTRSGYERDQLARLYQELLGRLEAIAGVRSAALSGTTPIEGAGAARFINAEGFAERPEDRRYVSLNWVGPDYFDTFGTPLLVGRDFRFEDNGRSRVAIVNQATARHYFGSGQGAIGRHFTFDGQDRAYEIVGVVGDAKYTSLHETAPRTIYLNAFQDGRGQFSQLAIRTDTTPTAVMGAVRLAVRETSPGVAVAKVTTMSDQMDASLVPERLSALLSGFFGGLGTLLAAIGLYGLLAYTVARRTTEIGVRMALGATRGAVTAVVLRGALALVLAGVAIGAPLALLGRRVLVGVVEGLAVGGIQALVFAAAVMIGVALLAAYVPARRASRVQPIDAIRHS